MSLVGDLVIVVIAVWLGTKQGFDIKGQWYVWALIATAILLGAVLETEVRPIDNKIRQVGNDIYSVVHN